MTEDVLEPTQTEIADQGIGDERNRASPEPSGQPGSNSPRVYVVRLRRDLQIIDVTRMLHYLADFGSGDSRGHELNGGWCLRLTELADLQLLSSQCADLIEGHEIEYVKDSE